VPDKPKEGQSRFRFAVTAPLQDLAAVLRGLGVRVGVGELLAAHRALAAVDAGSREEAFYALRATLCSGHADQAPFALAFEAVFGRDGGTEEADPLAELGSLVRAALPRVGIPTEDQLVPAGIDPVPAAWSDDERLRERDFAAYTDAERAAARRLLARLAARGPTRVSRRTRPTRRRGHVPDLRATARASLPRGGELLERRWRAPTQRRRRLVLVLDVSGSMAPYARTLLQYVQASVAARSRVEAFAFGTHLTRVTLELAGRDPDAALERASERVTDWSGGTRIGASLATLNREHGRRLGRGAFVVILSDGWDRGDPDELAAELERLRRTAHRLVWLNPLAADPRYEPLTRGMRAATPHLDRLLPGNTIRSLEDLADLMEGELA
jgi:uncharacterized protein with von Willebrand factor type A (vWA) domain